MRSKVYILYTRVCSNDLYTLDCMHISTYMYVRGDVEGKVSIVGDDWIGVREIKRSYVHVSSANVYQDRSV
jgi:hypothetical protein